MGLIILVTSFVVGNLLGLFSILSIGCEHSFNWFGRVWSVAIANRSGQLSVLDRCQGELLFVPCEANWPGTGAPETGAGLRRCSSSTADNPWSGSACSGSRAAGTFRLADTLDKWAPGVDYNQSVGSLIPRQII